MKKHIVVVDDEHIIISFYIREFELAGFQVSLFSSVGEAKKFIDAKKRPKVDMFILDLVMPPNGIYSMELASQGILTGLFLARDVREIYKTTPIIILTSCPIENASREAERIIEGISNCDLIFKSRTPPQKLLEAVKRYFEGGILNSKKDGIWERLTQSIIAKPTVYGVGVDLKKLFGKEGDSSS